MTTPDSRDSVERVVADMRAFDVFVGQRCVDVNGRLKQWADRLQALARGPQQAGR